jgi:hypothetical protein
MSKLFSGFSTSQRMKKLKSAHGQNPEIVKNQVNYLIHVNDEKERIHDHEVIVQQNTRKAIFEMSDKAFFLFGPKFLPRRFLFFLLTNPLSFVFSFTLTVLNIILHMINRNRKYAFGIGWLESVLDVYFPWIMYGYLTLFTLEIVLRMIVLGPFFGRGAFFRNKWNTFEIAVVWASWIASPWINLTVLRMFIIFRFIDYLRIFKNILNILDSIWKSLPKLRGTIGFLIFVFYMFSICGVDFFRRDFGKKCVYIDDQGNHLQAIPEQWCSTNGFGFECPSPMVCTTDNTNPNYDLTSFDNIAASWLLTFQIISISGWSSYYFMAASAESFVIPLLWWGLLIFVVSFVIVNLFVVCIDATYAFVRYYAKLEKSASYSKFAMSRRLLMEFLVAILLWIELKIFHRIPSKIYQKIQWLLKPPKWLAKKIVMSFCFDSTVMFVILFNVTLEIMSSYKVITFDQVGQRIVNWTFIFFYCFEIGFSMLALGPLKYLSDNFNKFDVLVIASNVITSFIFSDTIFDNLLTQLRLLRLFSVLARIPFFTKIMEQTFKAFFGMLNLTVFVFVFVFGFSLIANQLFQDILPKEVGPNFSDVSNSMFTMFKILTGDTWEEQMYRIAGQDDNKIGKYTAIPFFIFFYVISRYIIFSLFTVVVLEAFESVNVRRLDRVENFSQWKKRVLNIFRRKSKKQNEPKPKKESLYELEELTTIEPFTERNLDLFVDVDLPGSVQKMETSEGVGDSHSISSVNILQENVVEPIQNPLSVEPHEPLNQPVQPKPIAKETFKSSSSSSIIASSVGTPQSNNSDKPFLHNENDPTRPIQQIVMTKQLLRKKIRHRRHASDFAEALADIHADERRQSKQDPKSKWEDDEFDAEELALLKKKELREHKRQHSRICCIPGTGRIRYIMNQVEQSTLFQRFFILCVLAAGFALLFEESEVDKTKRIIGGNRMIIVISDITFLILFSIELIVRLLAYGYRFFTKDILNSLDILLIMELLVSIGLVYAEAYGDVSFQVRGYIRLLRALRPLRLIFKLPDLKLYLRALRNSLTSILLVFAFCLYLIFVFAVITSKVFADDYKYCSDKSITDLSICEGMYKNSRGILTHMVILNTPANFDTLQDAFMTLLEILSLSNWAAIIWPTLSSDFQGTTDKKFRIEVALLFVTFVILTVFFVLNLLIGVITEAIGTERGQSEMSTRQKFWNRMKVLIMSIRPQRKLLKPSFFPRKILYIVVHSRLFNIGINVMIALCTVLFASQWSDQPFFFGYILDGLVLIVMMILGLEVIAKTIAYGPRSYFASRWHRGDAFFVICTFLSVIVVAIYFQEYEPTRITLKVWSRIFLIVRVIKIGYYIPSIKFMLETLILSLPSILNTLLMLVFIFLGYSLFGLQLFGHVKYHEVYNKDMNFRTIPGGMLLLLRVLTLENWNGLMYGLQVEYPYCPKTSEISHCGNRWLAYAYFFSFFAIASNLVLSLFIGIILDFFSHAYTSIYKSITEKNIRGFTEAWKEFDPYATGYMKLSDVKFLVDELQKQQNGLGLFRFAKKHGELFALLKYELKSGVKYMQSEKNELFIAKSLTFTTIPLFIIQILKKALCCSNRKSKQSQEMSEEDDYMDHMKSGDDELVQFNDTLMALCRLHLHYSDITLEERKFRISFLLEAVPNMAATKIQDAWFKYLKKQSLEKLMNTSGDPSKKSHRFQKLFVAKTLFEQGIRLQDSFPELQEESNPTKKFATWFHSIGDDTKQEEKQEQQKQLLHQESKMDI